MSVTSSRLSSVSSILKGPGIRAKIINQANRVQFKLPKNLKDILLSFESGTSHKQYENLVCTIRDSEIRESELIDLLTETHACISLLGPSHRLFIEALLTLNWTTRSLQVTTIYKGFLEDLVSAHNYHAKLIIDKLVDRFKSEEDDNTTEWEFSKSKSQDLQTLRHVHDVLRMLMKIIPMATDVLLQSLVANYPYWRLNTQRHEIYIYALLQILEYAPHLRSDILSLIINRLIVLDVYAPRSEIDECEDDEDMEESDDAAQIIFALDEVQGDAIKNEKQKEIRKMKHPVAHTLDVCMEQVLAYIYNCCHNQGILNWESLKSLYHDVLKMFEQIILPTHASQHVQFIMFYICSFKPTVSEAFVNWLWQKVSDPNVAPVIRQSSVSYIASLLARATFIQLEVIKTTLLKMSMWIHSYISSQDSLECANSDVRVHGVFYTVCQAMFYVIAFRHKHLVETRKNLLFLQSLNLTKIIACRLNPLKVCQSAVVRNFAAVTRTYQLAYCYTIIEHNARSNLPVVQSTNRVTLWLDTFFPFDPYILLRSGPRFTSIYMVYQGSVSDEESTLTTCRDDNDDDDFMDETSIPLSSSCNHMDVFSYGTSPGFLQL
ncbi:RNA polymerase I-specific transcription initiation factor RRN3 [Neodiprion virginianus]|uniref:RNA polymerase I-specific transcription initiation factor RRN3 n=1 Tax=Neodiprion virginianus TaxID=2961670 RepID=UPI001EE76D8E|nr:RNA polymerase I-specific transcription initiation factor RRN3 [Neodiprion virginianus]